MQPYTSRGRPQKKPSERDVCTQFRHNVRTKQSISTVFPPDAPFHSFIFFRGGNLNLFPDARRDPIGRGFLCGSREFIDFEKKNKKILLIFKFDRRRVPWTFDWLEMMAVRVPNVRRKSELLEKVALFNQKVQEHHEKQVRPLHSIRFEFKFKFGAAGIPFSLPLAGSKLQRMT